MKQNILKISILTAFTLILLFSCVPAQFRDKDKDNSKIEEAISERIKQGGSIEEALPPTIVIIMGIMTGIVSIVGFFTVIYIGLKLNHKKTISMIEKGIYNPKPLNFKWEILFLFTGIILALTGIGISIWMVGYYGAYSWSILGGFIPFCIGLAFILFWLAYYMVYAKNKK